MRKHRCSRTCEQAHVLVSRLPQEGVERPEFPFVVLLVSGGHCCLVLAKVRLWLLRVATRLRGWLSACCCTGHRRLRAAGQHPGRLCRRSVRQGRADARHHIGGWQRDARRAADRRDGAARERPRVLVPGADEASEGAVCARTPCCVLGMWVLDATLHLCGGVDSRTATSPTPVSRQPCCEK